MEAINKVTMTGFLTKDAELKELSNNKVCRLQIASIQSFLNKKTDSLSQETCYIDIDIWGPQAETLSQRLHKGDHVLVEGKLKLSSWKDAATGQKRSRHSIAAERVINIGNNQQPSITQVSPATDTPAHSQNIAMVEKFAAELPF